MTQGNSFVILPRLLACVGNVAMLGAGCETEGKRTDSKVADREKPQLRNDAPNVTAFSGLQQYSYRPALAYGVLTAEGAETITLRKHRQPVGCAVSCAVAWSIADNTRNALLDNSRSEVCMKREFGWSRNFCG
jgi:hypothetical protein